MTYLLFMQHGWADDHRGMLRMAQLLSGGEDPIVVAPDLGWWKTWWRMAPLIDRVQLEVETVLEDHPNLPWRIVGHSMGGLIWLELLHRFPQWHDRVESLVLVGSPVGGADLGRIFDPFNLGIGVARDLGISRRPIAQNIAIHIPTLSIAGDLDGGSDGVVNLGSTQFNSTHWRCFEDIFHPNLRSDSRVISSIQQFWQNPITSPPDRGLSNLVIDYFRSVEGMADGHPRNFPQAKVSYRFSEGVTIRLWRSLIGVNHVYVADATDRCLFTGYVGWPDSDNFYRQVENIPKLFGSYF